MQEGSPTNNALHTLYAASDTTSINLPHDIIVEDEDEYSETDENGSVIEEPDQPSELLSALFSCTSPFVTSIRTSLEDGAPTPISQIATRFEATDAALKIINSPSRERPRPPGPEYAVFYDDMEDQKIRAKKELNNTEGNNDSLAAGNNQAGTSDAPAAREDNASTAASLSRGVPMGNRQSTASSSYSRARRSILAGIRRSTLVAQVNNRRSTPVPLAFHEVEATLVEGELYEATLIHNEVNPSIVISNPPIYQPPTPIHIYHPIVPWYRRRRTLVGFVGLVVIIVVLAGAVGALANSEAEGSTTGAKEDDNQSDALTDEPSHEPTAVTTKSTMLSPSHVSAQTSTGSKCLLVTTGTQFELNDGLVDLFVDSGNGYVLVSTSGKVYSKGELVLDQCFDTILGIQVSNNSGNDWAGTFLLSVDRKATYHPLACSDCSGTYHSILIHVGIESGAGCLIGQTCTLEPTDLIWKHVDKSIKGDAIGDGTGGAVALSGDGMILVVGAQDSDFSGADLLHLKSGHVKVLKWDESSSKYKQLGEPIRGKGTDDNFGYSLALSSDGKTLAIGGRWNDINGSASGYVKLFSLEDERSNWKDLGQVIDGGYDKTPKGVFGRFLSLSADGDTLAIGSPMVESAAGCVKVYRRDEDSSDYEELGEAIVGEAAGSNFGHSVSIAADGETLVIGAPSDSSYVRDSGKAMIYRFDDTTESWKPLGQELHGGDANAKFGWSVALSGNGSILAISAPFSGSDDSGYVTVYRFAKDELSWIKLGENISGLRGEQEGDSIDLSTDGKVLVIGTKNNQDNGYKSGRAVVYRWDEAIEDYNQMGNYVTGQTHGDEFGASVALSLDGLLLAVGTGTRPTRSGYVQVYKLENATLFD